MTKHHLDTVGDKMHDTASKSKEGESPIIWHDATEAQLVKMCLQYYIKAKHVIKIKEWKINQHIIKY